MIEEIIHKYWIELFAQLFALAASLFSLQKKSVSLSGFLSMLLIATFFIWKDGISPLVILFSMFASASLLTRYKQKYKSELTETVLKKHGPRDFVQAFCNLGVATLCFAVYVVTHEMVYLLALLCSVAASNADSWASELGVLSKQKPRMITTFKPCATGISGGVTWMGTAAGMAGSVFIATLTVLLKDTLTISLSNLHLFLLVSLTGIIGMLLDSVLGATVQIIYLNQEACETENDRSGIKKSRGLKWVNNDVVNFLNSLLIALAVVLFYF